MCLFLSYIFNFGIISLYVHLWPELLLHTETNKVIIEKPLSD